MMGQRRILPALVAVAALALPIGAARSQTATGPPCASRTQVVDLLHRGFGERPVGGGLSTAGLLVELYAGPAGTWTIVATSPAGLSCFIAAGEAWESVDPPTVSN